jgi:hypothetical protein
VLRADSLADAAKLERAWIEEHGDKRVRTPKEK